jgi:hypothetical protein
VTVGRLETASHELRQREALERLERLCVEAAVAGLRDTSIDPVELPADELTIDTELARCTPRPVELGLGVIEPPLGQGNLDLTETCTGGRLEVIQQDASRGELPPEVCEAAAEIL